MVSVVGMLIMIMIKVVKVNKANGIFSVSFLPAAGGVMIMIMIKNQ